MWGFGAKKAVAKQCEERQLTLRSRFASGPIVPCSERHHWVHFLYFNGKDVCLCKECGIVVGLLLEGE